MTRLLLTTLASVWLTASPLALPALPEAQAAPPAATGGGPSLDQPFPHAGAGLPGLVGEIFKLGIALIVIAAAIFIAIGAYMYFLAAGNAKYAETGKEYISRSVMGLILGLLAYIILQAISPQFVELKELTPPAPQGGGSAGGEGGVMKTPPRVVTTPERPQQPPGIDPNVFELVSGGKRTLSIEQTGPDTFRFVKDKNPQTVMMDEALERIDKLRANGNLRAGDRVRIVRQEGVAPTSPLYTTFDAALKGRGLTLHVPGVFPKPK